MVDPIKKYNPYHKEAIKLAEESKLSIILDATLITETPNDAELGNLIRKMYITRCTDADSFITHIKTLMNQ